MEPPCLIGQSDNFEPVNFGIANYESVVPVTALGVNEVGFHYQVACQCTPLPCVSDKPRLPFQLPVGGAVAPV